MAPNPKVDRAKRFLGIDPDQKLDDSAYYDDGAYLEKEPSTKEAILSIIPTRKGTIAYLRELFPFVNWILHYNLTWLMGDIIAGEFALFSFFPSQNKQN